MEQVDHTNLHRTAKYFMDSGRASTHDEALALLEKFGLTIYVGEEIAHSVYHQIALLTLINVARRTLLGGIAVFSIPDCANLTSLVKSARLIEAVQTLGGMSVNSVHPEWPSALIGDADALEGFPATWRVTWEGWRGGVVPAARGPRLNEREATSLAPALAAAICAAEAFAFHTGDHPMAGKRATGLSLWRFNADWLVAHADESSLAYLPSRLWVIGLGNLGQAFAWLLALLPYTDRSEVQLVLQDFDRVTTSNDSTSLLSFPHDIGKKKARVAADWLDAVGFETIIEERRFGPWTKRNVQEPGVALCGVDNAQARATLDDAGFDLIIEVGLGGGPQAFRSMALHTFPGSRTAGEIWARQVASAPDNFEEMPAYRALKDAGMDKCGLAQLASRTVGVPFVGLIAACLGIAELLRRLNGGMALEFASGSAASLQDFEFGHLEAPVYSHGHVAAIGVKQLGS